jgi:tetratricopeptide (TPR) repeat protein
MAIGSDSWPTEAQRPVDPRTGAPATVPADVGAVVDRVRAMLASRAADGALAALSELIEQTAAGGPEWLWAAAQSELGDTIANVPSPESDAKLLRIIDAYSAALRFYSPTVLPGEYARVSHNLANAYLDRRHGTREQNIEDAIAALQGALEVRTREHDPYGWARSQNTLGNALAVRVRGDRAQNSAAAVAAYRRALEVHRPNTHPGDYAMDETNLALALQERIDGVQTQNLDQAMVAFMCALLVIPAGSRRYGRVALSLAEAFSVRLQLTPPAWRAPVMAALQPAVDVLREAEQRYGIPTDAVGRESVARVAPSATPLDPDDPSDWIPPDDLFIEHRDAYFGTLSMEALLDRLQWPEVRADPEHQASILRVLEESLQLDPLDDDPTQRGRIHAILAGCYSERRAGDRAENLERALEHIQVSVDSCPREHDPERWAGFTITAAQMLRDRRLGDRQENLERAVSGFESAMEVLTKERHAYYWARTQNSLGLTYREMSRTNQRAVGLALSAFAEALTVLTREAYPDDWAGVQQNVGETCQYLRTGSRARNIEFALTAFQAAMAMRPQDTHPDDWARLHHNLGQTYRVRIEGERAANLEQAREHLRLALQVHTLADRPADHRSSAGALGMVLADQRDWPGALEAFASAATAEEVLLAQVSTGAHGIDDTLVGGHSVGELIGFALVSLGRLDEAVAAIERGRARTLADGLALRSAVPDRIRDRDRRARFEAAAAQLVATQAQVNEVIWSDAASGRTPAAAEPGSPDLGQWHSRALALSRQAREARQAFDTVVAEIQHAGDPPDLLTPRVSAHDLGAEIVAPVVYIVCTAWGGVALAVLPGGAVTALALPQLTDEAVSELVQITLDDGTDRIVGGFAAAQEGVSLDLILDAWPGSSFADKMNELRRVCGDQGITSSLAAAGDAVLALDAPGLTELTGATLETLTEIERARLGATVWHEHLRAELARCLPELARIAMGPTLPPSSRAARWPHFRSSPRRSTPPGRPLPTASRPALRPAAARSPRAARRTLGPLATEPSRSAIHGPRRNRCGGGRPRR